MEGVPGRVPGTDSPRPAGARFQGVLPTLLEGAVFVSFMENDLREIKSAYFKFVLICFLNFFE